MQSEKERRRYLAVEAVKFGFGGKNYIDSILGCRRDTVIRLMRKIATKTGLTSIDQVIKKLSQTKRKATMRLAKTRNRV